MVDLTADQFILLNLANLCIGGHELSYSERSTAIWEAFRLGREYENCMHLGQAKSAPAGAQAPGVKA